MAAYYTQCLQFAFFTYQCILESVPNCQIKAALFFLLEKRFLGRQQRVALLGAAGPSLGPRCLSARSAPMSQECQVCYLHLPSKGQGDPEAQEAGMFLVNEWRLTGRLHLAPEMRLFSISCSLACESPHAPGNLPRPLQPSVSQVDQRQISPVDLQGWRDNLATDIPPSPGHSSFLIVFLKFPSQRASLQHQIYPASILRSLTLLTQLVHAFNIQKDNQKSERFDKIMLKVLKEREIIEEKYGQWPKVFVGNKIFLFS